MSEDRLIEIAKSVIEQDDPLKIVGDFTIDEFLMFLSVVKGSGYSSSNVYNDIMAFSRDYLVQIGIELPMVKRANYGEIKTNSSADYFNSWNSESVVSGRSK